MRALADKLETFIEVVGKGVNWLSLLLVLVVCLDVLLRSAFRISVPALQESAWHFFGLIFLLGAAYTLKHDRHVRVDLFYTRFSPRRQAIVNIAGTILFLIPFSLVILITSFPFVENSFLIGETSPDPGGLPARYLLKAAIPAGFILLLLQSLASLIRWTMVIVSHPGTDQNNGVA